MAAQAQRAGALSILLAWLGFLAGWTAGSVPLTLAGASFESLWIALVSGLCGSGLALRARGVVAGLLLSTPGHASAAPPRWQLATAALATLLIVAATGWFISTGDARPLWGISLLSCLLALSMARPDSATLSRHWSPQEGPALSAVALLALALWLIYIVILRHDADDAFYLNLPIGLASAPHGMLAWDTMYGAENWPVLGSNYRVEALQTLIAAIAWSSGLPVVYVAHLVLPTIWCLVWAATLAVIGTALFGRKWWLFSILAVLSTFAFAGTLQSWGVHGISRLFHGKAPLILIVIPLIYILVRRTDIADTPLRITVPLLAGLICVALGLTANAIYIAPLALGLASFANWIDRGFAMSRRLWILTAATPAAAAGLWLMFFDTPVTIPEDADRSFIALGFWNMFPGKILPGLMALTLGAGAFAALVVPSARFITGCLLGAGLFTINPFLWPVYDDFVTGGLNFRLWWATPLPLLLAILLSGAALQTARPVWAGAAGGFVLLILSLTSTGLFGMGGTDFKPSFTKRPADTAVITGRVAELAGPDKVLASENISAWLPTIRNHPPLVYVRRIYLDQNMTVVPPQALAPRRTLANWINGAGEIDAEEVAAALQQQCPRFIVFPEDRKPPAFDTIAARYEMILRANIQQTLIYQIDASCQ